MTRQVDYYMQWTVWAHNRKPVLKRSPDGPAVILGMNPFRGSKGYYFVGFPDLDIGRWVDANIVNEWPEFADTDFPIWVREQIADAQSGETTAHA